MTPPQYIRVYRYFEARGLRHLIEALHLNARQYQTAPIALDWIGVQLPHHLLVTLQNSVEQGSPE